MVVVYGLRLVYKGGCMGYLTGKVSGGLLEEKYREYRKEQQRDLIKGGMFSRFMDQHHDEVELAQYRVRSIYPALPIVFGICKNGRGCLLNADGVDRSIKYNGRYWTFLSNRVYNLDKQEKSFFISKARELGYDFRSASFDDWRGGSGVEMNFYW
jgi:hypothetical protein